jgi:hypothetical protein
VPDPFDPAAYGPAVAALLVPVRVAALGPGTPNRAAHDGLTRFDPTADLGRPVRNADAARACLAGLWLYHDFLDESHTVSQDLPTADGSFWHAVMHRREPDAGNSKYWWRRVGSHPVLDRLVEQAPSVGYDYTTPFAFVDLCERARGSGSAEEEAAERVQLLEWRLLFDHCYREGAVIDCGG